MTTVRSTLRCDDGTDVPFEWISEDAPEYEWLRDRAHWTHPMLPMEGWLFDHGWPGADRTWAEVDMIPPAMFHRFQFAGPFMYIRMTPEPLERMMTMAPRYMQVAAEHGGALGFWQTYCEPRIKQACEDLAKMQPPSDLGAAAELWLGGLHHTFTSLAPMFPTSMQLRMMLAPFVGDQDAELTVFEVTQGGDNATQAIDAEIWELAEIARATPAVARILAEQDGDALTALRNEPSAAPFVKQFDALIAQHASRSQAWQLVAETWGERPEAALALVRAQTAADRVSPDELRERSARTRKQATERVLALLPAEKHAEFLEGVGALDGYVSIREGRAYWQMVICGEVRLLLLRNGEALVRDGRIDDARDILFLTPEQIAEPGDLRGRVAQARAEHERYSRLVAPPMIGTPGEVAAMGEAMRAELRGSPASRGAVTGTARILHSPEEGARLQPGDILVCVMTTPAWTPLFAIAGGIVTETGGALSHPAITAREYGIPAVVALAGATARFKDGDRITVDGGAGTVTLAGAKQKPPLD